MTTDLIPEDSLTSTEVAKRLGVARSTVNRWIRIGELPAVRIGRHGYRVAPADVAAMVTQA